MSILILLNQIIFMVSIDYYFFFSIFFIFFSHEMLSVSNI